MREASVSRKTLETSVEVSVRLDGSGTAEISTPYKFLNHMLELLAFYSLMDIELEASGSSEHHVVEDAAIALGSAIKEALGKEPGNINRFGHAAAPMDDALVLVSVDLSGRGYPVIDLKGADGTVDDTQVENLEHFLGSLALNSGMNLHVVVFHWTNKHHLFESMFKSLGLALRQAMERDLKRKGVTSTKGTL